VVRFSRDTWSGSLSPARPLSPKTPTCCRASTILHGLLRAELEPSQRQGKENCSLFPALQLPGKGHSCFFFGREGWAGSVPNLSGIQMSLGFSSCFWSGPASVPHQPHGLLRGSAVGQVLLYENHLEGLLNPSLLGPTPEFLILQVLGRASTLHFCQVPR